MYIYLYIYTSLYKSQVEKVSRTVKLYKNKSMAIEDTWETGKNKVETTFQWLTYAKTTVTEGGILLEQNGKSLHLKIETPDSKIKPVIVIEDVSMPKAPQDSPNPNLSRILIKTTTEAQATGRFLIGIYPSGK